MNCRVCQTTLDQSNNFCPECGERVHPNRLSVKSFFRSFLSEFFDYDNRFLKTFRHMFTHPERVIDGYVDGNRKQYVNVLGYLSISLTLVAIQIFVLKRFFPELLITDQLQSIQGLDLKPLMDAMFDYQGILTIAFTPFTAMMSRLTFIDNKRYNLAEHMVINVYPTAQFYIIWFFFTGLVVTFGWPYQKMTLLVIPILFLYMFFILKRIYELRVFEAIWRTLVYFILCMVLYFIFYFVALVVYVAYLTSTGQFNP